MELDSMLTHDESDIGLGQKNTEINTVEQNKRLFRKKQIEPFISPSWKKNFIFKAYIQKLCALLLLFLTIGGAMVLFVSYRTIHKNAETTVQDQVESPDNVIDQDYIVNNQDPEQNTLQQSTLTNNQSKDNDVDNIPFRMKSSSQYRRFESPEAIGQMNIYIKKPAQESNRYLPRRFRFPVARYNRQRFPSANHFTSFLPRTLIFADRRTRQTIIYSSTGGVYILPPLVNSYGQLFAIAELIASGYASLVSTGIQPNGPVNMAQYFRPIPLVGPHIPRISYSTGSFIGGVRVRYGFFPVPKYPQSNSNGDDLSEFHNEDKDRSPPYSNKKYHRPRYPGTYISPKPRALVSVDTKSIVGILFDDIPSDAHVIGKRLLDKKTDDYWRDLAVQQIQYTQVRLIFRPLYYTDIESPSKRGTLSLTLPEFHEIKFTTQPYFTRIDGHYLYVRNFTFHNILITDVDSLAESDDRLAHVGGSMTETFHMPVDPFLILQRTSFACFGEAQWPPNSIDPETTEFFYDDTCGVEEAQAENMPGCQQCHCSYPLPTLSCIDAIKEKIGHIKFDLVFTRIADNPTLANRWRFPKDGPSINTFGEVAPVNLIEIEEDLAHIRFVYLYINEDGCEIEEKCVSGTGWRRLMLFSTTSSNYGINDLNVGQVTYFLDGEQSDYVAKHRIYEYSPCHKHFHFVHYAQFAFGEQNTISNTKHGFCLQTTYRHTNTEWSVMAQNHFSCSNQGIAPGWSDTYQGGIRCQWIDVTTVDTSVRPHTDVLSSYLNPDNFICEGTPLNETWIETEFKTTCCSGEGCCGESPETKCCGGLPVEKQGCKQWRGAEKDNTAKVTVTVPLDGEGQITADCATSSGKWGEKRDCGFRLHPYGKLLTCNTPGQSVTLKNVRASEFYQIVRVCEASRVLNSCLACIWNASLTTKTIKRNAPQDISFTCTPRRDSQEIGGKFCIYIAPLFEEMHHNPKFIQWSSIE